MSGAVFTVSTAAEFQSAIAQARGGDTILMAPGAYDPILVWPGTGYVPPGDGQVTIRSLDPENPAQLSGLQLREAEGLIFEDLVFKYNHSEDHPFNFNPFLIRDSADITIRDSVFEGALVDGYGVGFALRARESSNITVENTEFFNWGRGAIFSSVTDLSVVGNEFHSIRVDGTNFTAVQNVLIEGNHFHSFGDRPDSTAHRDMIQFWTSGTSTPSTDIVIRGNTLDIGDGSWAQAIFMRNELVDTGRAGAEMFYRNILIEDNIIYNAHTHGITVGETDGLIIRENSVLRHEGELHGNTGGITVPVIRVASTSTDVTITQNVTSRIVGADGQEGWVVLDNFFVNHGDPTSPGYYGAHFITSTRDHGDGTLKYIVLPDSEIATLGAGSPRLLFNPAPEAVVPLFQVTGVPGSGDTLVFDARLTMGPEAAMGEGARFIWHFGDGTSAEGPLLRHSFDDPGRYDVVLEIIGADGSHSFAQAQVGISGAQIASFDGDRGGFVRHGFGEETVLAVNPDLLVATDTGTALQLGGAGLQARVPHSALTGLFGNDNFELSFTIQSDGGTGEIARIPNVLVATVWGNGSFGVEFSTDDGARVSLVASGIPVNDGAIHDITVRFSGDADRLEILMGDEVVAGRDVTGAVRTGGTWNLDFGPPANSGRTAFDGLLHDFDLRAIAPDFLPFGGDAQAVTASADAPVMVVEPAPAPVDPTPVPPEEEDHGAIAPWQMPLLDGFVLDPVADAERLKLFDDAHVVFDASGYAIRFDGDGDAVSLGRLQEFEASQKLGFSIDYTRDLDAEGSARLVWNHQKFGLTVGETGLSLAVGTADEGFKWFSIRDAEFVSGAANRITVLADAEADRLQIIVNDRLVFEETDTDLDFVGAGGREWGWNLGVSWGHFFDGEVHDFRVSDRFEFLETQTFGPDDLLLL